MGEIEITEAEILASVEENEMIRIFLLREKLSCANARIAAFEAICENNAEVILSLKEQRKWLVSRMRMQKKTINQANAQRDKWYERSRQDRAKIAELESKLAEYGQEPCDYCVWLGKFTEEAKFCPRCGRKFRS